MRIVSEPNPSGEKNGGPTPEVRPSPVKTEQATILARHNQDNFVCVTPADFTYGPRSTLSSGQSGGMLPYCFDIPARQTIYLGGLRPDAVRAAPFYYLYARRTARTAFFQPWHNAPSDAAPLFLFSAGRCGSTLLCKMLNAAGLAAVSEPDFYTQFTASLLFDANPNGFYTAVGPTLRRMTAELCDGLTKGGKLVIKLRADVCMAARPLLQLFPDTHKTLFLYRDFPGWARSTLRSFPCKPTDLIAQYLRGLHCLAVLQKHSDCHLLRYEDLIANPVGMVNRLSAFFGIPLDLPRALAAMTTDAQAGTPLARGQQYDPPDFEARLARALTLWQSPIHQAMIADLLPPDDA